MLNIFLSGQLAKTPETRTSRNGNTFTLASIRIPGDSGDLYASITAFSDLAPVLAGMQRGDPATVIGQGKVTSYQGKDGDHRAGLSIVATRIIGITDHQAPMKQRKPKGDGPGRGSRQFPDHPPLEAYGDEFTDRVPF